ncbi:MAG: HD domain-containing protein [Candidatus Buchananbacteria bacterium]|nr:HD domain-containing protein [Candidatus Buchananbacteria bacterium]
MSVHWTYRIRKAIVIASNSHEGQRRKEANIPYNAHLWGVCMQLSLIDAEDDVIIAGICHDLLEDTPMQPEILGWLFGDEVLRIVQTVTEPDKELPWEERKQTVLKRIGPADMKVKLVKCADKLDNLQSIAQALEAEGYRPGESNSQAKIWQQFSRGYEGQKWFNQSVLKALFENVTVEELSRIFGKYLRLVEQVFDEKVTIDEKTRAHLAKDKDSQY